MSKLAQHMIAASNPPALDPEQAASEFDRLDEQKLSVAMALLEQDWHGAARAAYRAAWHFHRLPREMQEAFVVSDLHDDDGPMPVLDDWSASAFVVWLVYRMNRSIEGLRTTKRPSFDEFGRRIVTEDQEALDSESSVERHATYEPETASQAALFEAPAESRGVAGKL